MQQRTVAVLGGGHGAKTMAADLTLAGHSVRLFEFESLREAIEPIFTKGKITLRGRAREGTATIALLTHDIAQAIDGADIIMIVVPSLYHLRYAEALAPHLKDGQHVVLVPGTYGSLEFLTAIRARGCKADVTLSELDTLPYACRTDGPTSVQAFHAVSPIGVGVFPARRTGEVVAILRDLYAKVDIYRDVLEAGLANTNPIIHPLGALLNAGRIEYARGEFYYYEEGITPSTARAIEAMDAERLAIARELGLHMLPQAEALHKVGYGPKGDLWETLKGSKGLTPIKGPTSLAHRYFTEDIPIGLVCWAQLGAMLGVPTPLMRATVDIGGAIAGVNYWETGRTVQRCGIAGLTAEELCEFAMTGKRP